MGNNSRQQCHDCVPRIEQVSFHAYSITKVRTNNSYCREE